MIKKIFFKGGWATLLLALSSQATSAEVVKPKMTPLGVYDAGQVQAGIYKLLDPTDGVICYILAPERALQRQVEGGVAYEGNSLGSISCVKAYQPTAATVEAPTGLAPTEAKPAQKK